VSWLRTDDNFPQHPKFKGWSGAQKWAFVELMHYCARYRTGGHVPADLNLLPRPVNARLLGLAETSGWLDRDTDGELWIHDWFLYNGTLEERVESYLAKYPEATANDVHKALGGNRQAVLVAVRDLRESGSV
jgi:hypothetical protein